MVLDPNELDALLSNSLTIDFVRIKLVQNAEINPIIYSGPGTISQDSSGSLQLKMYHEYQNEGEIRQEVRRFNRLSSLTPGKIISNDVYFSFSGKDVRGREWTSDSILVHDGISNFPPQVGKIITTNIRSIKNESKRLPIDNKATSYHVAFVPRAPELPYNKFEKSEFSATVKSIDFRINNQIYTVKDNNKYIQISISSRINSDLEKKNRHFLEALGIGVGKVLRPTYTLLANGENYVSEVLSDRDTKKSLPPPIPARHQLEALNLQRFVSAYVKVIKEPFSSYYSYWYRILSSSSDLTENHILVITTSIEGILKDWYSELMDGDKEFIEEVEANLGKIDEISLPPRVKNKILSNLNQSKSKSAKNALYKLLALRCISKNTLGVWEKARHKAAHGDPVDVSEEEYQRLLDNSYSCLALFYSLLLNTIKYEGPINDYSTRGWPVKETRKYLVG